MKTIEFQDFLNEIKVTMKIKKISQLEISKELGMCVTTLSLILNGKRGTFNSLRKIIDYVNTKEKK